ncbi:MAG: hypothetical protein IJY71_01590, partial [Clostridia bacterium]|nr:hypothetical protein [Clostridia bacterium]
MKKRLLSLLLVACMLLSLVPVFSTVAVAADTDEAGAYDYSKLYVTDGLLGLYTAYTGDSTLDLANKVWKDVSGKGNDATVNGTWTAGTYGGFGYDLAAKDNGYNLTFPSDVLPTDEYTLEIVASVRGLTQNADGVTELAANGAYNDPAGFSLGRLRGFFWFGPKGSNERYANAFVHMITEADTTTADGWSPCGVASGNWNTVTKIWQSDTSIVTGGIALTTANDKYMYSFYKDNALCQPTASTTCAVTEGSAYQGNFILFRSVPATVYSVRLYADTLTTLEKAQNHFADLAAFYQLDLADFDKLSAERKAGVYQALHSFELSADAYADGKKAVEEKMAFLLDRPDVDYASLYVGGDSLVGLYTSFIGDASVDMLTGEWKNSVANGPSAQITTVSQWNVSALGAIGYDAASITIDRDGTQTTNRSLQLPLAFNGDNFTVEVLVNWRMCLDEAGTRLGYKESAPATAHPGVQAFRFGRMGSFCYNTVTMALRWHYSDWNNALLGSTKAADGIDLNPNRPYGTVTDGVYANPNSAYRNYYDTGRVYNQASFYTTDFGSVYNVGLVAFTKTTDTTGTEKYGTYTQTKAPATIATITQAQKDLLDAATYEYTYTDENGDPATGTWDKLANSSAKYALYGFTLFNESPAYLYAVRVYNRTLNDAEKNMNYFVDICAFYGVDLTGFAALSQAKKEKAVNNLLDELKGYSMQNNDMDAYLADAAKVRATVEATLSALVPNAYDMLYVGADGSDTANGGKLLLLYNAYEANNSAVPEIGTWFNKVGDADATFVNGTQGTHDPVWEMRGNGVGYDVYGGPLNADGTINTATYLSFYHTNGGWSQSWGTRLDLPLDVLYALNDGDYTLDYVSKYDKIKVRNADDTGDADVTYNVSLGYRHYVLSVGSLVSGVGMGSNTDFGGVNFARWAFVKTGWDTGSYNNTQMYKEGKTYTTYNQIVTNSLTRVRTNGISVPVYAFYEVDENGEKVSETPIGMVSKSTWNNAKVAAPTVDAVYTMTSEAISGSTDVMYIFTAKGGDALAVTSGSGFRSNIYAEHFGAMLDKSFVVKEETRTTDKVVMGVYGNGTKTTGGTYYTDSWAATSTAATYASYSHMSRNIYWADESFGTFALFNLYPTTVYNVRMYDVALTAEENAQNHFADLCAYYGVDIEGFANATADAKTAAYEAVAALSFVEETAAEFVATKAKVQAAVDNAKATE